MQSNLDIINITLPLSDSDIEKYFGHFNEYYFRIDYGNSLDNLKTNDKIYTYLENCGFNNILLWDYIFDKDFEKFLLKYVKQDRPITIPILSELWISILWKDIDNSMNPKCLKFIKEFRKKYKQEIKDIKDLLYSINIYMEALIVKENKDIQKIIDNAEKKELKETSIDINAIALMDSISFYKFMINNKRDKVYKYKEFTIPCYNGHSLLYPFSNGNTPYANMIIYNEAVRNPDKIQKALDTIAKEEE